MLAVVAYVVALAFGVIAVLEARGRNWAGWGVIFLAAYLLYTVIGK